MADGVGLFDDAVRRRIALERYSTTQIRKTLGFLKDLERDLIGRLAALRSEATTRSGRIRLTSQERLLKSVQSIYAEAYAKLGDTLTKDMTRLAGVEAGVAGERLSKAASNAGLNFTTNELTATAAFEIAASRPMQGAMLKDWLADLEPSHRKRIEQSLRISFAEGESLETAIRRMQGAGLQNGRGLEALIRTSNAHIASSVTEATYEANSDIIEGVEWVSVLDGRTTDICRARDGKVWPAGEGPRPPAHIGCRSTTIPRLIGTEPVPREKYGEWLKRQPAEVQDDILGPARAKLFRDGRMTVDRFVDMKGKALTLEELGVSKSDGTIFSNFAAQIQTPGAKAAADFLAMEASEAGRLAERMLGQAGPALVAEGRASNVPVTLKLTGNANRARVQVEGDGFSMDRKFTRVGGELHVENALLSMHEDLQGKGYGAQIMRGSIAEYKKLGVQRVTLTANIDVGGYTWARFGYAPVDVAEFVDEVLGGLADKVAAGKLKPDDVGLIESLLRRGSRPDRLPADLARLTNAEGARIGKEALLETYWRGYLDLTNAEALAYFEKAIG